jgi:hypothetical protein
MQPWDAYLLYNALSLHFNSDSYDAIKYNYKTSARQKSFLARNDRYFFARLARQYPERKQLIDFLVANFTKWGKLRTFGPVEEYDETYVEWQKRVDALSYSFGGEMEKLAEHCQKKGMKFDELLIPKDNVVPIVNLWAGGNISLEAIVVLNQLTHFIDHANKRVSDTIFWPEFYRKVYKYSPFIRVDAKKFRAIVISRFTS